MNAMTEMPAPLVFTDAAASKVKSLIDEEGNPELKLRVFVTGGGCSGFQYGVTFDEDVSEDDTRMDKNGVTLLIDPMSYQYLVGAEIDYQEGLKAHSSSSRTRTPPRPAAADHRSRPETKLRRQSLDATGALWPPFAFLCCRRATPDKSPRESAGLSRQ